MNAHRQCVPPQICHCGTLACFMGTALHTLIQSRRPYMTLSTLLLQVCVSRPEASTGFLLHQPEHPRGRAGR